MSEITWIVVISVTAMVVAVFVGERLARRWTRKRSDYEDAVRPSATIIPMNDKTEGMRHKTARRRKP